MFPCPVEFLSGNIETYLHFLSILNNVMEPVVKILPSGRQGALEPT